MTFYIISNVVGVFMKFWIRSWGLLEIFFTCWWNILISWSSAMVSALQFNSSSLCKLSSYRIGVWVQTLICILNSNCICNVKMILTWKPFGLNSVHNRIIFVADDFPEQRILFERIRTHIVQAISNATNIQNVHFRQLLQVIVREFIVRIFTEN